MKKKFIKLLSFLVILFTFSGTLQTNAAPTINVGLTLNYRYTNVEFTIDTQVIFDNNTFWSVDMLMFINESLLVNEWISEVNKTALQHTYNYTQYERATGITTVAQQGFYLWIDVDGLTVGENITVLGDQGKVLEIIDITIPLGTFSVFNVTESRADYKAYYYYDVVTGFLIRSHIPTDDSNMILYESPTISEFPTFMLPLILIALPLTFKYKKSRIS